MYRLHHCTDVKLRIAHIYNAGLYRLAYITKDVCMYVCLNAMDSRRGYEPKIIIGIDKFDEGAEAYSTLISD